MMHNLTEQDPPYVLLFLLFGQALGHHIRSRLSFLVFFDPSDLGKKLFRSIIQVDFFFIHGHDLWGVKKHFGGPWCVHAGVDIAMNLSRNTRGGSTL